MLPVTNSYWFWESCLSKFCFIIISEEPKKFWSWTPVRNLLCFSKYRKIWKKPPTTCSLPRKFAKRFIRFWSKERLPHQWKARESGLLKIFFQMYKWTGKIPISYLFYVLRKRRVFQFKFLRRRVATNDFLLKIGKKETDSCSFCAGSPETLTYLFWHCRSTQTLE